MAKQEFTVTIRYAVNPKRGQVVILPSEEELVREESLVDQGVTSGRITEVTQADALRSKIDEMRERIAALDRAGKLLAREFTLLRPTYGEVLKAEQGARTIDATSGDATYDAPAMANALLLHAVKDHTPTQVMDLEPEFAGVLRAALLAALYPSPGDLDFLS